MPVVTGEVYDQVMIDGIYLPYRWCLLIATDADRVIGWQWCARETSAAYTNLMVRFPAPTVVVTDGGAGILKALRACWGDSRVQRCLFHVWANSRTDLTLRPRTSAGKALLQLTRDLLHITTFAQAGAWLNLLSSWHGQYRDLVNEKTWGEAAVGCRWWWTHDRLRKAYKRLERLAKEQSLFTYLDPQLAELDIQSTTNRIEGSINAGIRQLLARHKGLSEPHMRTATEWFLNTKSIDPANPTGHLTSCYTPKPANKPDHQPDQLGPAEYDTAIDYNTAYQDGSLHIRKGWAGHSN